MAASAPGASAVVERAIAGLLVAAVLIAAWGLDAGAHAAFDAPKRAGVLLCVALAGASWLWRMPAPRPSAWSAAACITLAAGLCAALGVALATLFSPHADVARDTLRTLALWSVCLPLGACALERSKRRWLRAAFALAIGSSAALSLLQAAGAPLPIELRQLGGRYPTGALLGNEGYVALAAALALPACVVELLLPASRRARVAAITLILLCLGAIAVNRQLTAAIAAGAGIGATLALHWRAQRVLRVALVLAAALALAGAVPALRAWTWAPLLGARVAELQLASTYRLGAWIAAEEMWRARPWLGHGLGTYATQSQHHRLNAELRLHERLTPPPTATHFAQAHNEYLQFAAEAGVPALLALLFAFATLLHALLQRAVLEREARVLAGVLIAGAVAALAWFPLQVPLLALLLLLAAGRAWRLIARERVA